MTRKLMDSFTVEIWGGGLPRNKTTPLRLPDKAAKVIGDLLGKPTTGYWMVVTDASRFEYFEGDKALYEADYDEAQALLGERT